MLLVIFIALYLAIARISYMLWRYARDEAAKIHIKAALVSDRELILMGVLWPIPIIPFFIGVLIGFVENLIRR